MFPYKINGSERGYMYNVENVFWKKDDVQMLYIWDIEKIIKDTLIELKLDI